MSKDRADDKRDISHIARVSICDTRAVVACMSGSTTILGLLTLRWYMLYILPLMAPVIDDRPCNRTHHEHC